MHFIFLNKNVIVLEVNQKPENLYITFAKLNFCIKLQPWLLQFSTKCLKYTFYLDRDRQTINLLIFLNQHKTEIQLQYRVKFYGKYRFLIVLIVNLTLKISRKQALISFNMEYKLSPLSYILKCRKDRENYMLSIQSRQL